MQATIFDPPVAPVAVTMAPVVRAARASGRQRVASSISERMGHYRNMLAVHGSFTDHEAASWLGKPLSVINAIRGDWKLYAEHHGLANPVQPFDRQRQDWGSGAPTSRTRWAWVGTR
jgi:hypothetical protein